MATSLVTRDQARDQARAFYNRHCREWAAQLCLDAAGGSERPEEPMLSIPLHPPTESEVLRDPSGARSWAKSWREHPEHERVSWTSRSWPSVGSQSVPERVELEGADAIASFSCCTRAWKTLRDRSIELADRYGGRWPDVSTADDEKLLLSALRKAAAAYEALSGADWLTLLLVTDWLLEHPGVRCYARELPIRGIDTKWFEQHRKAVSLLHAALTGESCASILLKPPKQVYARFLDDRLSASGLSSLSATPDELDRYQGCPKAAIICENLVSVMTLPPLEGVIAVHGGGYAVSDLASIGWLARIPVLYWGDLDSHGFAILNQWRHHHEDTRSLMMDGRTLALHRDLCVPEPTSSKTALDRLTNDEQAALRELFAGEAPLRLEQERIEWSYAVEQFETALARLP